MNTEKYYLRRLSFLRSWAPKHVTAFTACMNKLLDEPLPADANGSLLAIGIIAFDNDGADTRVMSCSLIADFVQTFGKDLGPDIKMRLREVLRPGELPVLVLAPWHQAIFFVPMSVVKVTPGNELGQA